MIKLIVTDMDGTFLNSQGDYNRESFQEVTRLMQQQGVTFAPCTGKQCERVEELFGDNAQHFYILGDSATRIKHNNKLLYQSLLNNQLGMQIIKRLKSLDNAHVVVACTEQGAFISEDTPAHLQTLIRESYAKVNIINCYSTLKEDFIKISLHDERGRCLETKPHLSEFFDKAYVVVSENNWMDITNQGVNKGTSVAMLQKMLAISPQETMVFGDGLNDLELMTTADFSFAMANGFDETKALANYIIGDNDNDSVMKTILQFLKLQT